MAKTKNISIPILQEITEQGQGKAHTPHQITTHNRENERASPESLGEIRLAPWICKII